MLKIESINTYSELNGNREVEKVRDSVESFQNVLKEFIKDVNRIQNEAGEAIEKAISGEITDIHDVMIAVEKAKTSFELLMEVRNKMLEAYKELMRLQV